MVAKIFTIPGRAHGPESMTSCGPLDKPLPLPVPRLPGQISVSKGHWKEKPVNYLQSLKAKGPRLSLWGRGHRVPGFGLESEHPVLALNAACTSEVHGALRFMEKDKTSNKLLISKRSLGNKSFQSSRSREGSHRKY